VVFHRFLVKAETVGIFAVQKMGMFGNDNTRYYTQLEDRARTHPVRLRWEKMDKKGQQAGRAGPLPILLCSRSACQVRDRTGSLLH
jgi:hypothetical protein